MPMKTIPLGKHHTAFVDDEDYEFLSQFKWYSLRGQYASANSKLPITKGGTPVLMHRLVIAARPGEQVDHIDGNGFNNQRSNLRLCTSSQNHANQKCGLRGCTRFKGVQFPKRVYKLKKPWLVRIMVNRKTKFSRYYRTPTEAACGYNIAAKELFGEFAKLNIL
jgi:hypothetical protein